MASVTIYQFSSVQLLSHVWHFAAPRSAASQASLSITNSQRLLKLMSIESVMPSNHLILCHPLLLLPSVFPSIRVFSSESVSQFFTSGGQSIGVFSFSISPSVKIQHWFPLGLTGLISLESKGLSRVFSNTTVQNINSSALSFLYGPTLTSIHDKEKTIALTRWTFVGKAMSLLCNTLSRLVIVFLPRSKHLLISWLQSPSVWFWSPKK